MPTPFKHIAIGLILPLLAVSALLQALLPIIDTALFPSQHLQPIEYWRLLSGHFVHADWAHWRLNMLGALVLVTLFYQDIPLKHWYLATVTISLFSSLCMVFFTSYTRYVGFSDTLHGWLALGVCCMANKHRYLAASLALILLGKLLSEQLGVGFISHHLLTEQTHVATHAHVFGSIGGLIYAALLYSMVKIRPLHTS